MGDRDKIKAAIQQFMWNRYGKAITEGSANDFVAHIIAALAGGEGFASSRGSAPSIGSVTSGQDPTAEWRAFILKISRFEHSQDEGFDWPPEEPEDARMSLDLLIARARDLISALPLPPERSEVAGWRLVPEEPTTEMLAAAETALAAWRRSLDADEKMLRHTIRNGRVFHSAEEHEKHAIRWRAMVDAAPLPAPPRDPQEGE